MTYTPNHELSRFSLFCDKQTELSECARWPAIFLQELKTNENLTLCSQHFTFQNEPLEIKNENSSNLRIISTYAMSSFPILCSDHKEGLYV